jgi:rubrerythrin
MPIDTPESLREHLELALKVEMTTVPLYLYAMYSIEDPASEAAHLLRSIATEEMLHVVLVGNLLLAVGGDPKFQDHSFAPGFPSYLPHHIPPLELRLERCSEELIRSMFMVIEQPESPGAAPEPDYYETLGQFYMAVEQAVEDLAGRYDLFKEPAVDRQVSHPSYYFPVKHDALSSGGIAQIDNLETALQALEILIHQGEGVHDEKYADPDHQELTHYYKFKLLADGDTDIGDVRPAVSNPIAANLPEEVRPIAELCDAVYTYIFILMDRMYRPDSEDEELIGQLYGTMEAILGPLCRYLMTVEIGDGVVAGPPFDFYEFPQGEKAEAHLRELAEQLDVSDHVLPKVRRHLAKLK